MRGLIAAVILFLSCAAAGAVNAERYRLRLAGLEALTGDLKELADSLKYERADVSATVLKLAERGCLKKFWKEFSVQLRSNSVSEAYRNALSALPLPDKEREILDGFMLSFGSGDIETELSRLELTSKRMESAYNSEKARLENRIRLSGTLSVLLGVALALTVL